MLTLCSVTATSPPIRQRHNPHLHGTGGSLVGTPIRMVRERGIQILARGFMATCGTNLESLKS